MADYKLIVQGAWKAMEEKNLARLSELADVNCTFVMNGQEFRGVAAFMPVLEGWMNAFPNISHTMVDCAIQGETLACEVRITGQHTGTMRTPNGDVPATHKTVDFVACDFVKFTGNKATTWHVYFDQVAMLTQLGLMK